MAGSLGLPALVAELQCQLGEGYMTEGRRMEARPCLDGAVTAARSLGRMDLLRVTLQARGRLARADGELEATDRLLSEAMEIVETLRQREVGESFRTAFLQRVGGLYLERVGVLLELAPQRETRSRKRLEWPSAPGRARSSTCWVARA